MKVKRTIELNNPKKYELGDIIEFILADDTQVEALAVKELGNNMLFCFVDCLPEEHCMNETSTTKGGFKASELNKYLNEDVIKLFPNAIKENMVEFSNDQYLRIPTEREIFGKAAKYGNETEMIEQWEPMRQIRNRMAYRIGTETRTEESFWYWLATIDTTKPFCYCTSDGFPSSSYACITAGVRPVFLLKN